MKQFSLQGFGLTKVSLSDLGQAVGNKIFFCHHQVCWLILNRYCRFGTDINPLVQDSCQYQINANFVTWVLTLAVRVRVSRVLKRKEQNIISDVKCCYNEFLGDHWLNSLYWKIINVKFQYDGCREFWKK